jgi:hypothetical protein
MRTPGVGTDATGWADAATLHGTALVTIIAWLVAIGHLLAAGFGVVTLSAAGDRVDLSSGPLRRWPGGAPTIRSVGARKGRSGPVCFDQNRVGFTTITKMIAKVTPTMTVRSVTAERARVRRSTSADPPSSAAEPAEDDLFAIVETDVLRAEASKARRKDRGSGRGELATS